LTVAVTLNGPAVGSDAHVPFLADTMVPLAVPLVTPGVPLHALSGSLTAIVFAVGMLLRPGDTATLTCGMVQLRPLAAPTGATPNAPIGMMSATTDAKAPHRSHACPPGLAEPSGKTITRSHSVRGGRAPSHVGPAGQGGGRFRTVAVYCSLTRTWLSW
jgi:hypothetical protein